MSFNKKRSNSYCVGGEHYSATSNLKGILLKIKHTGAPPELLRGTCVTRKRTKSLIVSDQIIQADGLITFFKHLRKSAKNVVKNTQHSSNSTRKSSKRWNCSCK